MLSKKSTASPQKTEELPHIHTPPSKPSPLPSQVLSLEMENTQLNRPLFRVVSLKDNRPQGTDYLSYQTREVSWIPVNLFFGKLCRQTFAGPEMRIQVSITFKNYSSYPLRGILSDILHFGSDSITGLPSRRGSISSCNRIKSFILVMLQALRNKTFWKS